MRRTVARREGFQKLRRKGFGVFDFIRNSAIRIGSVGKSESSVSWRERKQELCDSLREESYRNGIFAFVFREFDIPEQVRNERLEIISHANNLVGELDAIRPLRLVEVD